MDKKAQTGGLITSLVFGVASLVIGVIIALVIVSTLSGAGLLESTRTTATTTNESDFSGANVHLNASTYTLANFDSATTKGISITDIYADANQTNGTQSGALKLPTGYTLLVATANYSVVTTTGVIQNATTWIFPNVSITYVLTVESGEETTTDALSANFTEGIDNVSLKIPTVLLIAAIVLILSILAILVGVWSRMRLGGSGEL